MKTRSLLALALPLLALACSAPPDPVEGRGDSQSPQLTCRSAVDLVQDDASGEMLARAKELHEPTPEEIQATAFFLAVAVDAYTNGSLDEHLAARIVEASNDPGQAALFGDGVPETYAALAPACHSAGIASVRASLISAPYRCSDDCRITVADLASYFGLMDSVLQGLAKKAGGNFADLIMSLRSTAQTGSANTLSDAIAANLHHGKAFNAVVTGGEALANAASVQGAIAAVVGAEPVAAGFEAVVALLYLPIISGKILALARLIDGCHEFVATQCE